MDFSVITEILYSVFSFIIILSTIVFIHEFGHYWVAKKAGVKIDSFSIGFGTELFGWNDKSGTRWKVSLWPLGGYVKMFGDESAASTPDKSAAQAMTEEEKKVAFHTQPVFARFLIVLAGPMANFIFAIFILTFFFFHYGRPETKPVVSAVLEKSAAAEIGLQIGDEIVEFDGNSISRFEQIKLIASLNAGIETDLAVKREGEIVEYKITPKKHITKDIFGNEVETGLIGISSSEIEYKQLGFPSAVAASFSETYTLCASTLQALGQMITGARSADQISGVLRIADYSGKSMEQGLKVVFWFMAVLSINLGLVNLFPIPLLDGGHLFMYIFEAARGKPLPDKVQDYMFKFGFAVLVSLMLFATFNDLKYFKIF